jgi:predicted ester cyclase
MKTAPPTDPARLGHLFAKIMSSHDMSRLDEIVAPDYVNHSDFAEPGLEGSRKVLGAIIAGVPDLKVTAKDVFVSADGSRVVGRYRYDGTHTANLLGYADTGNTFAMRSIDIWRVENGRLVEHWDELNTLDVFIQMGAVSPPRQPSDPADHQTLKLPRFRGTLGSKSLRSCRGTLDSRFEGHRRSETKGRMTPPHRVEPAVDEAEAGDARLGLRYKPACLEQSAFQRAEKTPAHRVVVGVA